MRASVFEAIEEEDRVIEKDDGLPPALLGSCNDRAKQLHNSPSGTYHKNVLLPNVVMYLHLISLGCSYVL